jgi:toxin secretion/phage lysis holin
MMKEYNSFAVVIGVIGGVIAGYLGGYDLALKTLALLVVADYVSALIKAAIDKKLNPEIGYIGILKKVLIFLVVAVAFGLGKLLDDAVPLREITIMFYVSNEGLSFFKNASAFIPFPKKLVQLFEDLREEKEGGK